MKDADETPRLVLRYCFHSGCPCASYFRALVHRQERGQHSVSGKDNWVFLK